MNFLYGRNLTEIFDYCAKNKPDSIILNNSDSDELENDLLNFEFFLGDYEQNSNNIIGAYLLEKPLTSIELHGILRKRIKPFIEYMDKYFFTEVYDWNESDKKFNGEIYISRFKEFIEVGIKYKDIENARRGKEVEQVELADLHGLLYGYSLQEIFDYCAEKRPHLIK